MTVIVPEKGERVAGCVSEQCGQVKSNLDRYIPRPDVRERHQILIHAPADVVFDAAWNFDVNSIFLVRALFWLRAKILRASPGEMNSELGLVAATLSMGWSLLEERVGRLYISGTACKPWKGDVKFEPVSPEEFVNYAEPDMVKIAWTLEAKPMGPEATLFATETRVVATDDDARRKFRRYWKFFGAGIIGIRLLLLPALRRLAEREWTARKAHRFAA